MLTVFLAGLTLLPLSPSDELARGQALVEQQDYEGALQILFGVIDDCAATDAEVGRAYLTLGWAESALGRDDDARRSFAEALLVDRGAALPASAPERSRALLDEVQRSGAEPWGRGRLVVNTIPATPVEIDGQRYNAPAELAPPYGRVVVLTQPPVTVDLACRRLGTTQVDVFLAESMRVDDSGNVALVATGATLVGMGAVMGIVSLALLGADDPEPSAVLGIVGGAFIVGGAIPLGIAGINYAVTPPVPHLVRVRPPEGETYEVFYEPSTGLPRPR